MFTISSPACNRTSRPAPSTKTPLEPSDEELVQAAGDMEEYEQAGPSTASLPQRVSPAGPGEPTDEELLEATQEQGEPLQRLDPPEPPSMQETPSRRDPSPPPAEMLPQSWRAALTAEQQEWISQMLFVRDHLGRPRLTTDLNLWWFPPQPQPVYHQPPASPEPFFACRLFLWMPHRIWRLQLTCPQPSCTGSMAKAGLYRTIQIGLDIDGWYLMAE
ncbi:uncharacterized protein LOC119789746 isoform X1 [Cyprinodon tularosa]|uniref:uncharacterized protein LOC119789746 isoform X1 n=2 Tax=Cyprinodon tularosa TaxID=77115 RepID=UPI0018E23D0D|nr:uncharacterized protein LOC119789746 isoform X1 [Cyprinodon tularosa]XP_038150733.1 uncharacterized protein LOC119789746 isoform X1 [Cyprinodon tularosa]XP_038150734.1 uncharacterized protein LOC119789746 isoform X1 [Cyprinodon tularosa]XP_038150735.1 uncharacterized protein LOC119789746 isoform X1 [Cyprinodon tularosa]